MSIVLVTTLQKSAEHKSIFGFRWWCVCSNRYKKVMTVKCYFRLKNKGYRLKRYPLRIARYRMISHLKEYPSPDRYSNYTKTHLYCCIKCDFSLYSFSHFTFCLKHKMVTLCNRRMTTFFSTFFLDLHT